MPSPSDKTTAAYDLTPDRVEAIRLRDALQLERRKAELQAGLLRRVRGADDEFTQEAERRLERLTEVLEVNRA